jgi:hypothetical protein
METLISLLTVIGMIVAIAVGLIRIFEFFESRFRNDKD